MFSWWTLSRTCWALRLGNRPTRRPYRSVIEKKFAESGSPYSLLNRTALHLHQGAVHLWFVAVARANFCKVEFAI